MLRKKEMLKERNKEENVKEIRRENEHRKDVR
jgi:hypothetical protein